MSETTMHGVPLWYVEQHNRELSDMQARAEKAEAEVERAKARHTRYLDIIGEALKDARMYTASGEPSHSDGEEIKRLIAMAQALPPGFAP